MTYFTPEQWARIPLPLKQRWWKDTNYSAHDPRSPSLISMWWAIRDGLIEHMLWDKFLEAYDYENELVPASEVG